MKYIVKVTTLAAEEETFTYTIDIDEDERIRVNDEPLNVDFQDLPRSGLVSILLDNHSLAGVVGERDGNVREVLIQGDLYSVEVQDERAYRLAQARGQMLGDSGEASIRAPMPGSIIKVPVAAGDAVAAKQTVVILESMKMENELKSPRAGVVVRVAVESGDVVEKGQVLAVIGDAE